jgi:hypothetical protein
MHFIVKITIDTEINLPENHKSSEKFILWSVGSLHSTGSPKIGFIKKYFTEKVLKFPKFRSGNNFQKQLCPE